MATNTYSEENDKLEALEKENLKLKNLLQERKEFRRKINYWGFKIISLLVVFYISWLMIAPKELKPNDITTENIILVSIILLLNSEFLEKIESFSVDGTKISAKFQYLETRQDQQKNEIDKLQQKQIDLNNKQIDKLSDQQNEINDLQARQKFALGFLYRNLLEKYEIEKIEKLKESKYKKRPFILTYIPAVEKELRHLRALGFIKQKYHDKGIRSMKRDQEKTKGQLDLTQYFQITNAGEQYLELVKEYEDLETSDNP